MNYSQLPFASLVEERGFKGYSYTLFITVSPNPQALVSTKIRNRNTGKISAVKRPYGLLPQRVQKKYCEDVLLFDYFDGIIDRDYEYVGVYELNSSGNVHAHFLLNCRGLTDDVQLAIFRRDILNGFYTQQSIKKGQLNPKDWMNSIVRLTKPLEEVVTYLSKTNADMLNGGFLNYYGSNYKIKVPKLECV